MIDLGQIKHMGVEDPAEGEVLMYDSGSGKFRNIAPEETAPGRKLWENRDIADRLGGSGYEYVSNKYYINANNNWAKSSYRHWIIPLSSIRKVTIVPNAEKASVVAFLKTYTAGSPPTSAFSDKDGYSGRFEIETGSETTFAVPPDADYLYVYAGTSSSHASKPAHVYMTGIGVTEHTGDGSGFVKDDGTVDHATYLTQQDISGKANTDDLATAAFSGDYNDLANKPTIPADKLFRCQFANENGIGLLNGVTPNDIYEANGLGKTVVCQLIFGNFDVITTLTSVTEGLTFVGITEDLNGQTICYKLKYDTTEQEWSVTTINISSFLTAGDISTIRYANATASNGDIIVTEAITYPLRVNDVLYLVKFIDALPTTYSGSIHFHMNNPVDYPDVAYQGSYLKYGTDIIKQGDTCMFYFRNGVMTLLYNSRWGKMLSDSVTIYSGSSAPSSSIGRDGDIYIMTTT